MSAQDKNTAATTNDTVVETVEVTEPVTNPEPEAKIHEPEAETKSEDEDETETDEKSEFDLWLETVLEKCTELRTANDQYVSSYESSPEAKAKKENDGFTVGNANFWMCCYALMRYIERLARKIHLEENILELKFFRDRDVVDAVFKVLDPKNYHQAMGPDRNFRKSRDVKFDRNFHLTSDFRDRDTGEVKSRGEINTPLNSANGLTLLKAACLQGHGVVGFRMPRVMIEVPVGKKDDGKGKTKRAFVFTDKPVRPDHPKRTGKAKPKPKARAKGRNAGRDGQHDDNRHQDRSYLVYDDAADRLQERGPVSGSDLVEQEHLLRMTSPFHNIYVTRSGVGGLMTDIYKERGAIRTARREAKAVTRASKSGSRDNGKGGRKGGSKSRGGDRLNGKGGRKNPNSRVSMGTDGAAAASSMPKRKTTFFKGRPCDVVTRIVKAIDEDGFVSKSRVKVRVFLDDEGGEMVLGGKSTDNASTESKPKPKTKTETEPKPKTEPEPKAVDSATLSSGKFDALRVETAETETAEAESNGPAPGSWAAVVASTPAPVKVAEAAAEAESDSDSDSDSESSDE